MTGRKDEFKRKTAEKEAFKASRQKLEEDRAEREGRGYKQDLRDSKHHIYYTMAMCINNL